MEALLAQMACRIGDVQGNVERAIDALRGHPQVDIAVFPELYLGGYTYRNLDALSVAADGAELRAVADAAADAETAAVIGLFQELRGRPDHSVARLHPGRP